MSWSSLPTLTMDQRGSIATAEHLASIFFKIGLMHKREIDDTIHVLSGYAPDENDTKAVKEAFCLMLEALICIRDDPEL